jgi:hypothetical protein
MLKVVHVLDLVLVAHGYPRLPRYDLSDDCGVDLPVLLARLAMFLKQIIVRLEGRHYDRLNFSASPIAGIKNQALWLIYALIERHELRTMILECHGCNSGLSHEGTALKRTQQAVILCGAFRVDHHGIFQAWLGL